MLVVDLLRLIHKNWHYTSAEEKEQQKNSSNGGGWFI